MLIEEEINLKMNNMNIKHYRQIGFVTKMGETIKISTSQLSKGSHNKVKIKCDYCGDIFERVYKDYLKFKGKTIDKDCCSDCRPNKRQDNVMADYGVKSIRHVKEVDDKIKATNMKLYGVENPFESKEIRDKGIETTFKKFGVDNYFKLEGFHDIQKQSMLDRYGYEHYREDSIKSSEATAKRNMTLYNNQTAPTSMQQTYIHNTLGGELNYPVDRLMLDVAFPEEKIYLEYQGSGHNLSVKLNKITENDFNRKELSRYYYLKNLGWKMIEITSPNDILPKEDELNEIFNLAKDYLKETSYVGLFLEDNKIKFNNNYIDFKFNLELNYYHLKKHLLNK